MIWTDAIELCEFERRGWLYPDELSLIYRADCARRTARLERRVQLERHRTLALWHVFAGARGDGRYTATLDELVYGNARAMHELVALRVELDKLRARVVDSDLERGRISQQLAEAEEAIRFAHEEFRLAPVTIRFPGRFEAQINSEAPVKWDELPAVGRLCPNADGRDR